MALSLRVDGSGLPRFALDAAAKKFEQKITVKRPAVSYKNHIAANEGTVNGHV